MLPSTIVHPCKPQDARSSTSNIDIMTTELQSLSELISHNSQDNMILIPAGTFVMGSNEGEAEGPIHEVMVDNFWIDTTPVTNQQFADFFERTGYVTTATKERRQDWTTHAGAGRENHPVVLVSWFDAEAYARWAGKRLPTEAEWEKAARGGLVQKKYPWGDEAASTARVNWMQMYQTGESVPTTVVGSFPPNLFGIFDMAGNVWEWCRDWYDDHAYGEACRRNPSGPETGVYRVRRGASWNVRETFRLRCANRGAMLPQSYHPNLGFRCVRS